MVKKQRGVISVPIDNAIGNSVKGQMSSGNFDFMGRGVSWWIWKAEELDRVALLGVAAHYEDCRERVPFFEKRDFTGYEPKPFTLAVSFFLAALAIENLLKANLIKRHPEYVNKGKLRGGTITSHDLLTIAREAHITLDSDERHFCELATDAIGSFGRYPLAKTVSDDSVAAIQPTFVQTYEPLRVRLVALALGRLRDPASASQATGQATGGPVT
jgi:hypothetical protein